MIDSPNDWPPATSSGPLAVLCSGGLDSAVLLAETVQHYPSVYPIYIQVGAFWETLEREYLDRFLAALACPALRPLTTLEQPAGDLYGKHWSMTGDNVPDDSTPDEAVYLPGRNVLLLSKSLIWCHLNGVSELALATLSANPFPDATPAFFDGFADVVGRAVNGTVRIIRPYASLKKADVVKRVPGTLLKHTLSCIRPVAGLHCGCCNKCAERKYAFAGTGIADPTTYSPITSAQ